MAITWTNDSDARRDLGFSVIEQGAKGVPAASDYPTAGYVITAGTFGLRSIRNLYVVGTSQTVTTTAWLWQYNQTTGKLQAFGGSASSTAAFNEAANGTDLSAITIRVIAEGF